MIIEFTVPGQPKGKARPKVTVRGSYAHAYTPQETVEYENYVKLMYRETVNHQYDGRGYLHGAIRANIIARFSIPKSTSKKRRLMMLQNEIKYTKKADCDNIAKSILDALNGVAYDDDSQISELSVVKRYGITPLVVVTLTELGDNINEKNEKEI